MERVALDRLRASFGPTTDAMVVLGVKEGVLLGDDIIQSSPLLNNPIGRDLRGHLRRAGVMFRINDLCRRGDLPFATEVAKMPIGHWHWVEIRAGGARAHICRTDNDTAFPEDTPNKQDARLVNEVDLFTHGKLIPLAELLPSVEELYAWLTYGADKHGNLTHVCWAAPAADQNSWLAHVNILRSGAAESPVPTPPPSPDPKTKLRFREEIEEALEKKNDADKA